MQLLLGPEGQLRGHVVPEITLISETLGPTCYDSVKRGAQATGGVPRRAGPDRPARGQAPTQNQKRTPAHDAAGEVAPQPLPDHRAPTRIAMTPMTRAVVRAEQALLMRRP